MSLIQQIPIPEAYVALKSFFLVCFGCFGGQKPLMRSVPRQFTTTFARCVIRKSHKRNFTALAYRTNANWLAVFVHPTQCCEPVRT